MIPYLFVFIFSTLFTFFAEKCFSNKFKVLGLILSFLAIFIPAFIAGCRNSGIGTDTEIYVDYVFEKFTYIHSIKDLWSQFKAGNFDDIEIGYLFINYLASLFGKDVSYIYFFSNFFTILFIYLTIYKNRKSASMTLSIFIYLILYYNMSFNIVRQNIALAFGLFIFTYLENKKYIHLALGFILMIKFHHTSIFYTLFILSYLLINIKKFERRKMIYMISIIFLSLAILFLDSLIELSVAAGVLSSKFMMYVSEDNTQLFMIKFTLSYFFYFIVMLFIYKKVMLKDFINKHRYKDIMYHYLYLRLIGVIMILSSMVSKWAFRISFYFSYPADIIFTPRFFFILKQKNKKYYNLVLVVYLVFLSLYWYRSIVVSNDSKTYPYKSNILGF